MHEKETRAVYPYPLPPRRPEKPEEQRWPSPTPQPIFPAKDTGRVLKQILNRLDAMEKRLETIEKLLAAQTR